MAGTDFGALIDPGREFRRSIVFCNLLGSFHTFAFFGDGKGADYPLPDPERGRRAAMVFIFDFQRALYRLYYAGVHTAFWRL